MHPALFQFHLWISTNSLQITLQFKKKFVNDQHLSSLEHFQPIQPIQMMKDRIPTMNPLYWAFLANWFHWWHALHHHFLETQAAEDYVCPWFTSPDSSSTDWKWICMIASTAQSKRSTLMDFILWKTHLTQILFNILHLLISVHSTMSKHLHTELLWNIPTNQNPPPLHIMPVFRW